jgi:Cft2 family RNA processing exonuclease
MPAKKKRGNKRRKVRRKTTKHVNFQPISSTHFHPHHSAGALTKHSTFTTYLPIYSKETLNQMSPVYKDLFKKTKSN